MNIPSWIINGLAFIGFMFLWTFIAALVGIKLGKFLKVDEKGGDLK